MTEILDVTWYFIDSVTYAYVVYLLAVNEQFKLLIRVVLVFLTCWSHFSV